MILIKLVISIIIAMKLVIMTVKVNRAITTTPIKPSNIHASHQNLVIILITQANLRTIDITRITLVYHSNPYKPTNYHNMITLTNLVFTIESLLILNLVIIIINLINQVIIVIALLMFKMTLINNNPDNPYNPSNIHNNPHTSRHHQNNAYSS
jgi:hypothetical protein